MIGQNARTWLVALLLASPPPAAVNASEPATRATRYTIVVTGSELLSGVYADGHTYFLTRTLRPLGLHCVGAMCVDDNRSDLKEALRFAAGKAPLVIVTGGLGPTDNDITREALSDFTGIPLAEHPDVLKRMAQRFNTEPGRLRANLRRQTRVPTRGSYLENRRGTAVGLVFETPQTAIVALPGPPAELQPMVRDELVPYLSRRFGTRLPGCSLTLRFVGLGQSEIDQRLKDHVALPPDVITSSQFAGGRVDFTFTLPDDTPQNRTRLAQLQREIMKHLGEHIYATGDVSLEQTVGRLLAQREAMLALVEVGSGGTLAATLSAAEEARPLLGGAYVAPTTEKLRRLLGVTSGASDRQDVEVLAEAAAKAAATPWAVAVGPIVRDANRAAYVNVAFRSSDGRLETREISVRGSGEMAQSILTTQLLDQLRRRLQ
ncbi:MAG: CinA family protein [Sedimentisphaerales bacterium]|nr:CinA family protein [Sedimentisphaerales bacterium]